MHQSFIHSFCCGPIACTFIHSSQVVFLPLRLSSSFLLVHLVAHVDPVAVHVDGLAEMRDVARVLLPAHLGTRER